MGGRIKCPSINWLLLTILVLGALMRSRGILNPLLDDQGWRQADTASMAYHMQGHLTDIPQVWFPTLSYDGTVPQKVELEFPFLPYLLAWTWFWFGWSDLWGRLWGIVFSLLTIWGIFVLGKKCFSERVGLWAAGIYAFVPLTVYYGRVVMPEPVAQACTVWALNALIHWQEKPGRLRLVGAGLMMALTILAKLPQLMIFPVAIFMAFWPLKVKNRQIFAYSGLALFPPLLYYDWVHTGATQDSQFVSGILTGQVVDATGLFWRELTIHLREEIGLPVLFLAGVGTVYLLWKISQINFRTNRAEKDKIVVRSGERLVQTRRGILYGIFFWCIISLGYVLIICSRISLDYYLVPVILPFALLAGIALDHIEDTPGTVIGILVLSLLLVNSTLMNEKKYIWEKRYLTQALWLRDSTPQGSILILSDPPPMTFYYAQRVGYRLNSLKDRDPWHELAGIQGDYFVELPYTALGPEFWNKIRATFPEVAPGVYQLKNY